MMEKQQAVARLYQDLGYKPLYRILAKFEVVLGLLGVGLGLMMMFFDLIPRARASELSGFLTYAGLALFVLGGYLALAGHRSHLYQSANELTAYLAELIRNQNDKGHHDEHPR